MLGEQWETEAEVTSIRQLIDLVQFKAYYISLVPGRQGDYTLKLGIPHNQKDLAWQLSDHDGRMLQIAVSTMRRV